MYRWYIIILFGLICSSCNVSTKQNNETTKNAKAEYLYIDEIGQDSSEKFTQTNSKTDTVRLIKDSYGDLINGTYEFETDFIKSLPPDAKQYFSRLNIPYKLVDTLSIDYYCKRASFGFKDFNIFNTLNKYEVCEYVALVDTTTYIQIIAQQCTDMEMWLALFVIDQNYHIKNSELIMLSGGGLDEEPEEFGPFKVSKFGDIDSLDYVDKRYLLKLNETYTITDGAGNNRNEIGYRKIKILTVDPKGMTHTKDSLIQKKDYVKYHRNV